MTVCLFVLGAAKTESGYNTRYKSPWDPLRNQFDVNRVQNLKTCIARFCKCGFEYQLIKCDKRWDYRY